MNKTTTDAEAQLEAAIAAVINRVFPWLALKDIRHQIGFSIRLGHGEVKANGKTSWAKRGRADILVFKGDTALAVIELKRNDLDLTAEDDAQAVSYGRLLTPIPPLAVVTNGRETRIIETLSKKPWTPENDTEKALEALLHDTATVAADDRKRAIETLMGTQPDVWPQALRIASQRTIEELTAKSDSVTLPFNPAFAIPRDAALGIAQAIDAGKRLILLRGDPLIGKTNVAGQLAINYPQDSGAVLFVERSAAGLYRAVADILADALHWPATAEEARDWLRRTSANGDKKLIVVFDDFDANNADARLVVEELTGTGFGDRLHVVLCVDSNTTEQATKSDGRSDSILGRRATVIDVGPLSDKEFGQANVVMNASHIGVMRGGQYTPELRQPWLLQTYVTALLAHNGHVIPSVLSTDIIAMARERFKDAELQRRFRGLAKAAIQDAQDQSRSIELMLTLAYRFVLRRETVESTLNANDIAYLIQHGYAAPTIAADHTPLLSVRVPELLASELAALLATELQKVLKNEPQDAAAWLCGAASNFAFGDVIAAQAVFDLEQRTKAVPFHLIADLARREPAATSASPGQRLAMLIDGVGIIDLKAVADAPSDTQAASGEIEVRTDDGMFVDIHAWMILAHFASRRAVVVRGDTETRLDAEILLTVGRAPIVLRPPRADFDFAFPTHDLASGESVACYKAGVVEIPTLLIMRFLANENLNAANDLVTRAVASDHGALLARFDSALRLLSEGGDPDRTAWAASVLAQSVAPAFGRHIANH